MKNATILFAAMALSTSALAGISTDNPDMYGWVVDDPGPASSSPAPARDAGAARPGISTGNPDLYGWVVEDHRLLNADYVEFSASPTELGVGDSYGSILHSIGFSY